MVSYTYQMPSGIAGAVTRPQQSTIEQQILDQSTPPLLFGVPVKNVSGKLQPIGAGAVATDIQGILVRPYPTSGNGTDGLGAGVPNKALPADLLKRGYISVLVNNYAAVPPVKDGKVYVRVGNASTGKVIGNFEAAAEMTAAGVAGTNTGNGTITAVTAGANAQAGVYIARAVIAGTNSGTFDLFDPNGILIDQKSFTGSGGTAVFANGQINATITDGATDFVVGDLFNITVTANTILVGDNRTTYFTGGVDANGISEIAFHI